MGGVFDGAAMKAVVFTLGCKVNACESEVLIKGLIDKGYIVGDKLEYADLYIINTCAVTNEAERKSRQTIARVKKFNPAAKIIVTGCASEKAPKDFLAREGVTLVTGAKRKEQILDMLGDSGVKVFEEDEVLNETIFPENVKTRAFIKVQDGCDNFCSYCIIPYLRGRSRSRSVDGIISELKTVTAKEVVLTAINLSDYNYNGVDLSGLIKAIAAENFAFRVRLGSVEEGVIKREFLDSLKKLKNFAPHFHLSLQSGADGVLKAMNRHYTTAEFLEGVNLIREYYPDAGVTTDIICGFPTETDEDFETTLKFADLCKFSDIHVFNYSPRQGTVAANLKGLSDCVKKARVQKLLDLKSRLKSEFIKNNVGKTKTVVFEDFDGEYTGGYTDNYIRAYIKGDFSGEEKAVTLASPYLDGALCKPV